MVSPATPAEVPGAPAGPLPHDTVEFTKYSLCGNTFLMVDERRTPMASDVERSRFARWALDPNFGIGGADNVIYLDTWRSGTGDAYGFRIFEVDGSETLFCGNALLCVAALLDDAEPATAGTGDWSVWTEQPTGRPRAVRIGVRPDGRESFVAIGSARPIPDSMYRRPATPGAATVEPIRLQADVGGQLRTVTGWLTFTGEPHLVLILGHGLPERFRRMYFPTPGAGSDADDRLFDRLGWSVNRQADLFPQGVHVNVVDPANGTWLDYRTWERAINRETLACGSGALAIVHVCAETGQCAPGRQELRAYRCRRHQPDAHLSAASTPDGLVLAGRPQVAYRGFVACGTATS